ncbi:hypothetical protein MSG28_004292 [Choristoneura fumiferana]|uniref:Uncharacterized protein n=1 Tax=Choristoneura fumiferana TaxID=7141 RepID=A0ACC0KIV2_CHOFU|nr:hypothetical protein MSG28_004292 [Choristoneura fumiferana]
MVSCTVAGNTQTYVLTVPFIIIFFFFSAFYQILGVGACSYNLFHSDLFWAVRVQLLPATFLYIVFPSHLQQDLLKWYGWGYKDSMFHLNDETASFTGDKMPGQQTIGSTYHRSDHSDLSACV